MKRGLLIFAKVLKIESPKVCKKITLGFFILKNSYSTKRIYININIKILLLIINILKFK